MDSQEVQQQAAAIAATVEQLGSEDSNLRSSADRQLREFQKRPGFCSLLHVLKKKNQF